MSSSFLILSASIDPNNSCNGWMNMTGAQYAARLAFPSKIVLRRGNPKAKVLWEVQNVAAMTSARLKLKIFELKNFIKTAKLPKWREDKSPRRKIPWRTSIPMPFVKALQNAFHTKPTRINYQSNEDILWSDAFE